MEAFTDWTTLRALEVQAKATSSNFDGSTRLSIREREHLRRAKQDLFDWGKLIDC